MKITNTSQSFNQGRYCEDIQFCELQKCPGNSQCYNLDDGFDCLTNVTFQGDQTNPLAFTFHQKDSESSESPIKSTIEISFRTKTGGTLLYVQNRRKYFEIAVYKNQVTLMWNLTGELPEIRRFTQDNPNFDWQTLVINVQDDMLKGSFKGYEETYDSHMQSTSAVINQNEFMSLFSGEHLIYLGGMPVTDINSKHIGDENGASFKGCVGEARVGGFLLPFFPHDEIYLDKIRPRSHFRLNSTKPNEGCVLCFQQVHPIMIPCDNSLILSKIETQFLNIFHRIVVMAAFVLVHPKCMLALVHLAMKLTTVHLILMNA